MQSSNKNFFPFFTTYPHIKYFDSAATTLKPQSVINAILNGYQQYTMPCEKSQHKLAFDCYQKTVATTELMLRDIFAISTEYQIIFSHSVTILLERMLLLLKKNNLFKKEIITIGLPSSAHSSIISAINYQMPNSQIIFLDAHLSLSDQPTLNILYIPYVDHITGQLYIMDEIKKYKKLFPDTFIILDASQGLSLFCPTLGNSNADCIMASSHKVYGPDGVAWIALSQRVAHLFGWYGILSIKKDFNSGSLSYPSLFAYQEALNFLQNYIYQNIDYQYKIKIFWKIIMDVLNQYPKKITLISKPQYNYPIISFTHSYINAHDLSTFLDDHHICIRSGEICAPKLMYPQGIVRISLAFYNDLYDIEYLLLTLIKICEKI